MKKKKWKSETQEQEEQKELPKKKKRQESSRFRGVSFFKANKVWKAQITVNGKYEFLGYFDAEKDAALAYDKRAWQVLGVRANLNFPDLRQNEIPDGKRYESSKVENDGPNVRMRSPKRIRTSFDHMREYNQILSQDPHQMLQHRQERHELYPDIFHYPMRPYGEQPAYPRDFHYNVRNSSYSRNPGTHYDWDGYIPRRNYFHRRRNYKSDKRVMSYPYQNRKFNGYQD